MRTRHPSAVRPAGRDHPDPYLPRPAHARPRGARAAALLVAVSAIAAGCNISQSPLKTHAQPATDVAVSRNQLRLRMRSLVQPMCAQLEQTADAIIAGTTDPDVQMAALQWKIDAVPALRTALFQPDPAVAALDTAVLCYQMIDYFETGPGKRALGPTGAPAAAAACHQMVDELLRILASGTTSGDVSRRAAFARRWAAQHPVRRSIADRQSALALAYEGGPAAEEVSAGQAIADATTTMDDLNRKVDIYSDQLFRQARWEAERFARELVAQLRAAPTPPLAERAVSSVERASATFDRLAPALDRALAVARDAPSLLTAEREATLKAVHEEVTATTRFAHDERAAAMDQIARERAAGMQELREITIQQREQVTADLNRLTLHQIDYTARRVTQLVVIAMAIAVAAAVLGLFLARRIFRRRQGPP